MLYYLECIDCHEKYNPDIIIYLCKKCGGLLEVKYDIEKVKTNIGRPPIWSDRTLSVWKYKEILPFSSWNRIITLNEGNTKLHKCTRLNKILGIEKLYVKNEGENPTGSFKDRGMTVGVMKSIEYGVTTVVCASTGNTSASLAAYAAKAGIRCLVLIPSGKIAIGKLVQAIVYGAEVVQIKGNFDDALEIIMTLSLGNEKVYLLNSVNPYRLEGQKTLAFEVIDQLNENIPDKVILPVGNAGNISAIWKGFREFKDLELTSSLPEMIGIQSEGAAPIAQAIRKGEEAVEFVHDPETVATAIRIGSPVNWKKAIRAIRDSGGTAETVTDHEILEAQSLLAKNEGIFVEPASASSIAGLRKLLDSGIIKRDDMVVCVTTGTGLKDPDAPLLYAKKPIEIEADVNIVRKIVKG